MIYLDVRGQKIRLRILSRVMINTHYFRYVSSLKDAIETEVSHDGRPTIGVKVNRVCTTEIALIRHHEASYVRYSALSIIRQSSDLRKQIPPIKPRQHFPTS